MDYKILTLRLALMTLVGGVWYSVVYPTALPTALVLNSGSDQRFVPGRHMNRFLPITARYRPFTTCCVPSHFFGRSYPSDTSLNFQNAALVT